MTAFAVYVGARGVVNWVEAEVRLALSRAIGGGAPFPFVAILAAESDGSRALPGFAQQFQSVRDVETDPGQWDQLLHALANGAPPRLEDESFFGLRAPQARGRAVLWPARPPGSRTSRSLACAPPRLEDEPFFGLRAPRLEDEPFFGLRAIDAARNHLFFGRDAETAALVKSLAARNLVLVSGDSGSGKSSLVRAGLVPAWRGNEVGRHCAPGPRRPTGTSSSCTPRANPRADLGQAVRAAAMEFRTGQRLSVDDCAAFGRLAETARPATSARRCAAGSPPSGRGRCW